MSPTDFDEVIRLKRASRWAEAVVLLESILAASPADAQALTQLADVHVRERRFREAEAVLDQAEVLAGTTADSAAIRGNLRYGQDRMKDAVAAYREAAGLSDRATWPLLQLARIHLRQGALDAARGAAMQAAERDPKSGSPWLLLAQVAQKEGRPDAVELLEKAHELSPADHFIYARLIEAKLAGLPPEEQEREVEVLLRTGGGDNEYLVGVLAKLRKEAGNDRGAAAVWRSAREQKGSAHARKMEAYALRRAGSFEEAAALFRTCLLEEPEDMVLMRTYVSMQTKRGATDQLRETLEQMLPVAGSRRGAVYGELKKLGVTP
ncbi:MAG: tetratricopeptide repeat protein [Actinomycetota bacterium]